MTGLGGMRLHRIVEEECAEASSELSTRRWACQHSGVKKQRSWKRKGQGGGREIRRGLTQKSREEGYDKRV